MSKYHSIDNGYKLALIGVLAALLVPFIGPIWYGTKFTSMYYHQRVVGGLVSIVCLLMHTVLTIWGLYEIYLVTLKNSPIFAF